MAVYIKHTFLQGRFHATRWLQNPFADEHGEWPPSPWRLVRALAARWFQYSRETGDRDEFTIQQLLNALASQRPTYHLPASAKRGPALKQYLPTGEFAWSDPSAGSGAVKESRRTLFPDTYFVLSPDTPLFWLWSSLDLQERQRNLLAALLHRITYFGRAESLSRMELTDYPLNENCSSALLEGVAPVLCFQLGVPLRLDVILGDSDKPPLLGAPHPPGTEWVSYNLPEFNPWRANASEAGRGIEARPVFCRRESSCTGGTLDQGGGTFSRAAAEAIRPIRWCFEGKTGVVGWKDSRGHGREGAASSCLLHVVA